MILCQVVDFAFDAQKIAPQPKEADDQKERSTVLCQQQGHGRGCLLCTGPGHYMGSRPYFNYRLYYHCLGAVRIVRLATLAHPQVRNAGPACYSRGGFTGRDGR